MSRADCVAGVSTQLSVCLRMCERVPLACFGCYHHLPRFAGGRLLSRLCSTTRADRRVGGGVVARGVDDETAQFRRFRFDASSNVVVENFYSRLRSKLEAVRDKCHAGNQW